MRSNAEKFTAAFLLITRWVADKKQAERTKRIPTGWIAPEEQYDDDHTGYWEKAEKDLVQSGKFFLRREQKVPLPGSGSGIILRL